MSMDVWYLLHKVVASFVVGLIGGIVGLFAAFSALIGRQHSTGTSDSNSASRNETNPVPSAELAKMNTPTGN